MEIIQIPSKTYKLNNDVIVKQMELDEPTSVIGDFISINDSLNGYPLLLNEIDGVIEQSGEPTPDNKADIQVVTGDVTVKVVGKNLNTTSLEQGTINGADDKVTHTKRLRSADYVYLGNGTYTISWQTILTITQSIYIIIYDKNKRRLSTLDFYSGFRTFSIENDGYIRFVFSAQNTDITTSDIFNVQIEVGSTETEYEPYQGQSQLLSFGDIKLAEIENYREKLFKAVDGNMVYDSLTTEQKAGLTVGKLYKYKSINKKILNGTESWQYTNNTFIITVTDYLLNGLMCICDRFLAQTNVTATTQLNDKGIAFRNDSNTRRLYIKNSNITSAQAFKTWLSSNNVTLYYVLQEPIFEEITDTTLITQLTNFNNLKSYGNETNIYSTSNYCIPKLGISYFSKNNVHVKSNTVDTIDGYVDNKEAMKQAIYHILRTERYSYLIYSDNYGVELRQYIGRDFSYLKNTIEQTLKEALMYDLRVINVVVNKIEQEDKDKAVVDFTAYTIYGDLQLEVSVVV